MSDVPLEVALDKVGDGDVAVDAPEWSNQTWLTLVARAVIALLLFLFVAMIVLNVGDELPGEKRNDASATLFENRATEASQAATNALVARRAALDKLAKGQATLRAARQERVQAATGGAADSQARTKAVRDLRTARQQQGKNRLQVVLKTRTYRQAVAARSAALDDVIKARPSSDVDLVRAIGVGALAVLALVAAASLLMPRRSQTLSVRRLLPGADGAPGSAGDQTGSGKGVTTLTAGSSGGVKTQTPATTGISKTEPALTQGFVASAALIAGLFGIQEFEGPAEVLLNIVLPLVPIAGALFTRSRVAALPNIAPAERARLFNVA